MHLTLLVNKPWGFEISVKCDFRNCCHGNCETGGG